MKLLLIMRIHFVIFIAQFELYFDNDFYYYSRSFNLFFIVDEDYLFDFYKIKKILEKKIVNNKSQYLFK